MLENILQQHSVNGIFKNFMLLPSCNAECTASVSTAEDSWFSAWQGQEIFLVQSVETSNVPHRASCSQGTGGGAFLAGKAAGGM
jgi:hypothetical protein